MWVLMDNGRRIEERKGCDGEAVFVARGWP